MSGQAEEFEYVHLSGARFKDGLLPVAAVSELTRYQRLLVDVAKALFLADNPERQRVSLRSIDLESDDLLISALHDGSTGVELAVRRSEALIPANDYLERSRVLIEQAFTSLSEEGELVNGFPAELVPQLAAMGQSIPAGETYTWAKSRQEWEGSSARLTRSTTVPIRSAVDNEEEVEERQLHVFILGVYSDPLTFRYRSSDDGRTLEGRYTSPGLFSTLKENAEPAGRAPLVALTAMVRPGDDEIVDVLAIEQVLPPEWSQRLEELAALKDGWLDGSGSAISREAMRAAETLLFWCVDEGIARPGIFPTESGGIHLEWDDPNETEVVVEATGTVRLFSDTVSDDGVEGALEAVFTELARCLRD